ncbi:hypothetical protein FsymDg_1177 [Candidatus Protofrankia datiscae]|uniref:Uncharacterized protein n=1 Tax=Candidatus Protofrankia datiscae TaxID=2716812 RepID=F8B2K6_9ACTN|nr:hypothetical protein FsymDg_1177 [Candidatus Protofrankia datiscae]
MATRERNVGVGAVTANATLRTRACEQRGTVNMDTPENTGATGHGGVSMVTHKHDSPENHQLRKPSGVGRLRPQHTPLLFSALR